MKILSVSNLSKSFDDPLFKGVTFEVGHKDRIGLVGANGVGKTTLFKIILNKIPLDSGDVFINKHLTIGYMEQHLSVDKSRTVYGEVLNEFSHLVDIELELDQIHHDIDHNIGNLDALIKRQYSLQKSFDDNGGHTFRSRTKSMLLGLGFSDSDLEKKAASLSGGEQTKISLAKMLLSNANLLLLDEPTNHLDIDSVEWLEGFLSTYSGAFIVISHDRRFLDSVTNRTFDMKFGKLKTYTGAYSEYLKRKKIDEEQVLRDNKNLHKEIDRVSGIIEQQLRWNRERNIRTAESKQHIVDKLTTQLKETEKKGSQFKLKFDTENLGGKEVAQVKKLSKSFGSQCLFSDIDISVSRGERLFLLGGNGSGKTTLFKILLGETAPDSGEIKIGINVFPSYFDQSQSNLAENKTVFDNVADEYPAMTETQIRTILGSFLFVKYEVFKMVSDISGGERAKLSLLLLMLSKANFLLLDEPTNHLDINSKEALQEALEEYPGTMFIISHDRYLINEMADRILYLEDEKITEYLGNYDYYLSKREQHIKSKSDTKTISVVNEYKQKKELQSKLNRIKGKISRLEDDISKDESAIADHENEMAKPEVANDYNRVLEISKQAEELKDIVHKKYEELHLLEDELIKTQQ